jgi:hypothetical protein
MGLVKGRTFAATIPPGSVALDRLIGFGVQVAEALAAHDKGIVADQGRAHLLFPGRPLLVDRVPQEA